MFKLKYLLGVAAIWGSVGHAACAIKNSNSSPAQVKGDPFYQVMAEISGCPTSAQQLKSVLQKAGAKVVPAMVGNRGFHNPGLGSFSFFESVSGHVLNLDVAPGDFFFGHFTGATDDQQLVLDQQPANGKLLVELIAWDAGQGVFNFYELIGQGSSAQWFFRGDSIDILRDNQFVYRDAPTGQPKFGKTLRCSACHSSGGPIMKELAPPHNDWWTVARPLPLGPNRPSSEVQTWLSEVIDAGVFAQNVKNGIHKLETSSAFQKAKSAQSLQEQLRPLFCENEINLESSPQPLAAGAAVKIPSGFFLNPLLGVVDISVEHAEYVQLVNENGLKFPETNLADADHAWLTPVKGYSDLLAIQSLIDKGVVSEAMVKGVLSVDARNPVFSPARCSLLKLVGNSAAQWEMTFIAALKASSSPAAVELVKHLEHPLVIKLDSTLISHEFKTLLKVRKAVFKSEISQNPRGQILEPGFRVIFPEVQ